MKPQELIDYINGGGLEKYSALYPDLDKAKRRFVLAIEKFSAIYGSEREVSLFSVPGRSEIIGNHTDHNQGRVMAGSIDRDIIAVAAKNSDGFIRFSSEGYSEDRVNLKNPAGIEVYKGTNSRGLVAGMVDGFVKSGYNVGGYDAYSTTEVLKGSGLSSSAAFEVMVGNILNHFYNDGKIDNKEIAKIAQYSENVYFGKPCGLMDQLACAVGGFVYIDFEKKDGVSAEFSAKNGYPEVLPIGFSLSDMGYALCIVNTGGNHANLTPDYASVPREMKEVAEEMGREVLRGLSESELMAKIPKLREKAGDRAILRSLHFIRENDRVGKARDALTKGNLEDFFLMISESGKSSFQYLQNVYTTQNVSEQGLSLALALTDGFMRDKGGAFRVHGGGFAGTIQCFIKKEYLGDYTALMDSVFGEGAAMPMNIRPRGAVKLF